MRQLNQFLLSNEVWEVKLCPNGIILVSLKCFPHICMVNLHCEKKKTFPNSYESLKEQNKYYQMTFDRLEWKLMMKVIRLWCWMFKMNEKFKRHEFPNTLGKGFWEY